MLPLYYIKALGSGDIKLIMVIGLLYGLDFIIVCVLATIISGGVIAFCYIIFTKEIKKSAKNIWLYILNTMMHKTVLEYGELNKASSNTFRFSYAIFMGSLFTVFYMNMLSL